jgi:hypothetical protein
MHVADLAKSYLKDCFHEGALDIDRVMAVTGKDRTGMNRNELDQHNGALHL